MILAEKMLGLLIYSGAIDSFDSLSPNMSSTLNFVEFINSLL